MVGVTANSAAAFTPLPAALIATELVAPVEEATILRLLPSAVTAAATLAVLKLLLRSVAHLSTPATITGDDPNSALAFAPLAVALNTTELLVPVVSEVIARFPPLVSVTVAPAMEMLLAHVVLPVANPCTIVGEDPNSAVAFAPLPTAVIATELPAPVVSEVITRLVPELVTLAPLMAVLRMVLQLAAVSQFPEMETVCEVPSTTTTRL